MPTTEALKRELSFDQIHNLLCEALKKAYPGHDEYGVSSYGCRYYVRQVWSNKALLHSNEYWKEEDDPRIALVNFTVSDDQSEISLADIIPVQIVAMPIDDEGEPVVIDEASILEESVIGEAGKRNSAADAKKINTVMRSLLELIEDEDVEEDTVSLVATMAEAKKKKTIAKAVGKMEAVWSQKFINDLPDTSFAYVSPGGKKDDDGKTTPRSLRHLPFKDASGKVDTLHLRNALARLDQTDIPAAAKASARKKLQAAAKNTGVGDKEGEEYDLDAIAESSGWNDLDGENIYEHFSIEIGEASVDEENLVIKNTTILGPVSLNRRRYPESVQKAAKRLFEGAKAYLNHPPLGSPDARDMRDLIGQHQNIRVREGKMYSDLHLLNNSTVREHVLPVVKSHPSLIGNSIVARVLMERAKDGVDDVTKILAVRSVDLVTEPGTTQGLYESHNPNAQEESGTTNHSEGTGMEWKDISVEQLMKERPDLLEALRAGQKHEEEKKQLQSEVERLTKENAEKDRQLAESQLKEAARQRAEQIGNVVAEMKTPDSFKYEEKDGKKSIRSSILRVLEQCQTADDMKAVVMDWENVYAEAQNDAKNPQRSTISTESAINFGKGGKPDLARLHSAFAN